MNDQNPYAAPAARLDDPTDATDPDRCGLWYRWLSRSLLFAVFTPLLIVLMGVLELLLRYNLDTWILLICLVWLASIPACYIFLGMLASANLRRPWVWVSASVLTTPIGPFATWFLMRRIGRQNGWR
jgi:hypothetical protein